MWTVWTSPRRIISRKTVRDGTSLSRWERGKKHGCSTHGAVLGVVVCGDNTLERTLHNNICVCTIQRVVDNEQLFFAYGSTCAAKCRNKENRKNEPSY